MVVYRPALTHRSTRRLDILLGTIFNIGAPRVDFFPNKPCIIRQIHVGTLLWHSVQNPPRLLLECRPTDSPCVWSSRKAFSCEAPKQKMKAACDHQIKSEWIQLVNPASTLNQNQGTDDQDPSANSNMLIEPALTRDVLSRIDLSQYTLIEVNSRANPPICKIVSREALIQKERTKIKQKKEQQKSNRIENIIKEIQLTWKIDTNDLNHKLKTVQHCFIKGYKVRVLVNAPRYQQTDQKTKDELLAIVEEQLTAFGGELVKQETEGGKLIMEWHPINKQK
ncbi:hypothetical protein VP01_459g7 [Puccinia sorghi]|uniref:Uncharacterized protein n=1 Tax=Puccinia sorghi TaxID=27349 RepID=A0A0L6UPB8_9BASI|nr:hypothetical protein VP01_459g7 [Puccinia sorghi]